jgi:hypothetical protein
LYYLDIENQLSGPHTGGGLIEKGGITGKKLNATHRNDS